MQLLAMSNVKRFVMLVCTDKNRYFTILISIKITVHFQCWYALFGLNNILTLIFITDMSTLLKKSYNLGKNRILYFPRIV